MHYPIITKVRTLKYKSVSQPQLRILLNKQITRKCSWHLIDCLERKGVLHVILYYRFQWVIVFVCDTNFPRVFVFGKVNTVFRSVFVEIIIHRKPLCGCLLWRKNIIPMMFFAEIIDFGVKRITPICLRLKSKNMYNNIFNIYRCIKFVCLLAFLS